MPSRSLVLVLACLPALAACSSSDPDPEPTPNDFVAFDETVDTYLADNGLDGATAAIVTEDEGVVHLKAYGAFDTKRITLVASSSKIVSVGVLMYLSDQGMLDLDAPISDYLGDWGAYKTDITAAQLVSNSSGMKGIVDEPLYAPYLCQFVNVGTLAECAEAIYTADDEADRVPPDTAFNYGGGQWQLAGGLAEVVSGKSWAELIDEIYVQPCGLENTGYNNHFVQASGGSTDAAFSYPEFFTGDLSVLSPTDNPNIEGGMYTTIGDYAQILLMHLRGGMCGENRVLSEASVARMQADRIAAEYDGTTGVDPTMPGYGMGWWIARSTPVISDGGAYGATPWLDMEGRHATMFLIEGEATQGALFRIEHGEMVGDLLEARAAQ